MEQEQLQLLSDVRGSPVSGLAAYLSVTDSETQSTTYPARCSDRPLQAVNT